MQYFENSYKEASLNWLLHWWYSFSNFTN